MPQIHVSVGEDKIKTIENIRPNNLAVLSSVKVKDLTTVFYTVTSMCFRFMFLSAKILQKLLKTSFQ